MKYCSLKYFSVKNISSCTSHNLIQNPENGKKINKNCHFRHFLYFIEVLGAENEILLSQFFLCRKYTWSSTSPENLNVFLCFQNCFEVPKNEKMTGNGQFWSFFAFSNKFQGMKMKYFSLKCFSVEIKHRIEHHWCFFFTFQTNNYGPQNSKKWLKLSFLIFFAFSINFLGLR